MASRLYKRVAEVTIGSDGNGIRVTNLRISFEVTKTVDDIPNQTVIKIYNLKPDNENKVKDVYDEVSLVAGYQGSEKIIFTGFIRFVYRYRQGLDFITEIEAGDGELDYKTSVTSVTMAAGSTNLQLLDRLLQDMPNTQKGSIKLAEKKYRRGRTFSGDTRQLLNNIAKDKNINWSIQDGFLTMVGPDDNLDDEVIIVNASTGLLEAPQINDKGISVKTLINPDYKVHGLIKLDNNTIKAKRQSPPSLAESREVQESIQQPPVRKDPDGIYKIIKFTHKGDTRSSEWYSELECVGVNEEIPATRV